MMPVRNRKSDRLQVGSKVLGEGGRRVGDANVLEPGTLGPQNPAIAHLPSICHPFATDVASEIEELSVALAGARTQVQIGPETWIFGLDLGLRSLRQQLVPKSFG